MNRQGGKHLSPIESPIQFANHSREKGPEKSMRKNKRIHRHNQLVTHLTNFVDVKY